MKKFFQITHLDKVLKLAGPWIGLYLVFHIYYYQDGDVNALSRYATMRAMSMDYTFTIDDVKWSMDWSQAPNGHFYSNKAPGPMFVAYPVFWLIDHSMALFSADFKDNYKRKETITLWHKVLIPLIFQIIPLCFLVLLITDFLIEKEVTDVVVLFCIIAILFANTASLLMTTWFGHGFASCLTLAFLLAVLKEQWKLSGLFLGLAILSDYGSALFIPGLVVYLLATGQFSKNTLIAILIGGIVPGILWLWYHWLNFGGPFALPNMYQNPKFGSTLGGQFHFIPIPYYMLMLLVGDQRGLLYTQPWILITLGVGLGYLLRKKFNTNERALTYLLLVSFLLLLIMNAAFTGWHGGSTPGPRYLSIILPLFAIYAALIYHKVSPMGRHLLWVGLGIGMAFGALVYGTTILAYEYYTIWTWLFDYLRDGKGSWLRLIFYVLAVSGVFIYTIRSNRFTGKEIYT